MFDIKLKPGPQKLKLYSLAQVIIGLVGIFIALTKNFGFFYDPAIPNTIYPVRIGDGLFNSILVFLGGSGYLLTFIASFQNLSMKKWSDTLIKRNIQRTIIGGVYVTLFHLLGAVIIVIVGNIEGSVWVLDIGFYYTLLPLLSAFIGYKLLKMLEIP